MATTSASAAKMGRKTRESVDPLLPEALLSESALRPPRSSPRSKTWEREVAATVGEDEVQVYLDEMVHVTRQDTLGYS